MAQDYKIVKVSSQKPREYTGEHGTTYYIKVMLEGQEKPVEVGKKAPDALKAGDSIYGDIVIKDEYDNNGFKSAKKQAGGFGGGYKGKTPEEQHAIMRMNSLTNAVNHIGSSIDNEPNTVLALEVAETFYQWLLLENNNTKSEF